MSLFSYTQAKKTYQDNPVMLKVIHHIEELDEYHLLRNNDNLEIKNITDIIPANAHEYLKWMSVCNGGLLFSTTLLSYTEYDEALDISFSTLRDINSVSKREVYKIPGGYVVIAVLNYGAPVCLSECNTKIYLWEPDELTFTTVWDSFADFLADEYNTAVEMITDNAIEPVPIKVSGNADG